jgi:hypothetical protein
LAKAAISLARSPNLSDWPFRSSAASLIWLVVRVWLGYQWANAGYKKIWGSEALFPEEVRNYDSRIRKILARLEIPCDLFNRPGRGYSLTFRNAD